MAQFSLLLFITDLRIGMQLQTIQTYIGDTIICGVDLEFQYVTTIYFPLLLYTTEYMF